MSVLVRREERMTGKSNKKMTFAWSNIYSSRPRTKDGLKPNMKLTFIWSYAVHNRPEGRMAWSRTRSWPSSGYMLFTIAKKEGWLEAEHEVDLHLVICCSQSLRRKNGLKPNTKLAFKWSHICSSTPRIFNCYERSWIVLKFNCKYVMEMIGSRTWDWPSISQKLIQKRLKEEGQKSSMFGPAARSK